jgi:hypothetical protein
LIPSMTPEEMRDELLRDYDTVYRKAWSHGLILQKEMIRNHKKSEIRTINYKSIHNNNWTIINDIQLEYIDLCFYVEMNDINGKAAYSIYFHKSTDEKGMNKFNPHFFKRYHERCKSHIVKPSEAIRQFFKHNSKYEYGHIETESGGSTYIHFVFPEGIGIGWYFEDKRIVHMKTFIPHSMLTEKQEKIVEFIKRHNDSEEFQLDVKEEHLKNKL